MALICQYLDRCGGCDNITLESKINSVSKLLNIKHFQIFKSTESNFRMRAELGIYHNQNKVFYVMRGKRERFVEILNCQNLSLSIQKTLPILLKIVNSEAFHAFKERLFSLEILANQSNSLLLTLIYHRKLDKSWLLEAKKLKMKLEKYLGFHFEIIGRSRGVKLILEKDYLIESLEVGGRK